MSDQGETSNRDVPRQRRSRKQANESSGTAAQPPGDEPKNTDKDADVAAKDQSDKDVPQENPTKQGESEPQGHNESVIETAVNEDSSPAVKPPNGKTARSTRGKRETGDDADNAEVAGESDRDHDLGLGPARVLDPVRTDPVKALQARQRRLDRLAAVSMPEIHFVGQIVSGEGLISDPIEGACCRQDSFSRENSTSLQIYAANLLFYVIANSCSKIIQMED